MFFLKALICIRFSWRIGFGTTAGFHPWIRIKKEKKNLFGYLYLFVRSRLFFFLENRIQILFFFSSFLFCMMVGSGNNNEQNPKLWFFYSQFFYEGQIHFNGSSNDLECNVRSTIIRKVNHCFKKKIIENVWAMKCKLHISSKVYYWLC